MITIGLAHDLVISSAAVVVDGEVVAAIAEERLNRQKTYKGFPTQALGECLRLAGFTLEDVDVIAFGWNPTRHLEFPNYRLSNNARSRAEYLYAIPNMVLGHLGHPSGEWIDQIVDGLHPQIRFFDHQLTHAANAFYLSGWEDAAVFTADGKGEIATAFWGEADRKGIRKFDEVLFPHSLGLFYGTVTQFLGFRPDSDEWKVMALASYGKANDRYYKPMRDLVTIDEQTGKFWIDQRYFSYATLDVAGGHLYSADFTDLFGQPRTKADELDQRHADIAWATQRVFEESMAACLRALHERTGNPKLAAAGGCMMNSVYNGKIIETTPFEECFISSCPDDSGISVGAALLAYHLGDDDPQFIAHPHNYWGPSYESEIARSLANYKIDSEHLEDPARVGAELLVEGALLGWFQGAMEFGQRALGNRSILVDPRRTDAKDLVNAAVKYRESFRPFAPAILAERVADYFVVEGSPIVPFMERVFRFREEVREAVPAVVHVDGTGRLQSVARTDNERFYDLIKHFDAITGVPIVLNTSFNLNGEPIVASPTDAIRTFYSCGLDALILGDRLIRKSV